MHPKVLDIKTENNFLYIYTHILKYLNNEKNDFIFYSFDIDLFVFL